MTSIVFLKNKKNGKVYAYINEKVTNPDGKSAYKRKCIGHLDYVTGNILPNREKSESPEPIVKTCGSVMLLSKISSDTKLTESLQIVFPDIWQEILVTAMYILTENAPLCYMENWMAANRTPLGTGMDINRISEMLSRISDYDICSFVKVWKKRQRAKDITLFGISPVSNYIDRVMDSFTENSLFDQNIELEMCYSDRMPLSYVRHTIAAKNADDLFLAQKNSFSDIGVEKFKRLIRPNLCRATDIEELIGRKENYIMMIPNNGPIFDSLMEENWDVVFSTDNISADGSSFTNTVRKRINGRNAYVHFYFDTKLAETETSAFLSMIDKCFLELEHGHIVPSHTHMYENYFLVTRDSDGKAVFELNSNKIMKRNSTAGYTIIISDRATNSASAKELFDINNRAETLYDDIYNEMDRTELKLYYKQKDDARLFLQFVALILDSALNEFIRTIGLSGIYTVPDILSWMSHVYQLEIPGRKGRLISELDYRQKVIAEAAGLDLGRTG